MAHSFNAFSCLLSFEMFRTFLVYTMQYLEQSFAYPPTPYHKPINDDKFTNNFFLLVLLLVSHLRLGLRIDAIVPLNIKVLHWKKKNVEEEALYRP